MSLSRRFVAVMPAVPSTAHADVLIPAGELEETRRPLISLLRSTIISPGGVR